MAELRHRAPDDSASVEERHETALLQVRNLVKSYPGTRAVDGVSLTIAEGACFGLLGPNGAGKTTTVEIIEGITSPTAGEVLYRGEPLGRRFREEAGIQFQSTALQDYLTVNETLRLFRQLYPRGASLEEVISACALANVLDRDTRHLSGGQRQRLLLAMALINDPCIVFLDEPTTGLDPQARRHFWALIGDIKARRTTILLTTHYMEEAYVLCDTVAIMDHGKIIAEGSPEGLLKAHFDDVILQMPREDFTIDREGFPYTVLDAGDSVEISTPDVDGALRRLIESGVSCRRLRIRPRTLEDLFLELTGRELRG
ncbi:MAG: ABC transporter ATP-binding protein [Gammaproteobacteria bacterium]